MHPMFKTAGKIPAVLSCCIVVASPLIIGRTAYPHITQQWRPSRFWGDPNICRQGLISEKHIVVLLHICSLLTGDSGLPKNDLEAHPQGSALHLLLTSWHQCSQEYAKRASKIGSLWILHTFFENKPSSIRRFLRSLFWNYNILQPFYSPSVSSVVINNDAFIFSNPSLLISRRGTICCPRTINQRADVFPGSDGWASDRILANERVWQVSESKLVWIVSTVLQHVYSNG